MSKSRQISRANCCKILNRQNSKFLGYFETRMQSFISAFPICMNEPLRYTLISCRLEFVWTQYLLIKAGAYLCLSRLNQIQPLRCEDIAILASLLVPLHSQTVGSRENSITGKTFLDISVQNQPVERTLRFEIF